MRKKKKTYVQPSSEVVELQVTNLLLTVSGGGTGGFSEDGPDEEDMG